MKWNLLFLAIGLMLSAASKILQSDLQVDFRRRLNCSNQMVGFLMELPSTRCHSFRLL